MHPEDEIPTEGRPNCMAVVSYFKHEVKDVSKGNMSISFVLRSVVNRAYFNLSNDKYVSSHSDFIGAKITDDTRQLRVDIEQNIKIYQDSFRPLAQKTIKKHVGEVPATNLISRLD